MRTADNSEIVNSNGHLLLGLIGGIAVGAAIGVLFSPHKGVVSRRIILRKGEDIADGAVEAFEEHIEQLGHTINKTLSTLKADVKAGLQSRRCG